MQVRLPNNWFPRPYQQKAWSYLRSGGRHCQLVWHRRSGKDDLALHWTAVSAMQRVGNYWHTLPKANQARRAIWEAINPHTGKRRIDEAFPKDIRRAKIDDEMVIRFVNGSSWQVVGSDNFDSLVGSPPVGLVFSEWALCDPAAWAYLRPILAENSGWALFNTTPRGKNHAYSTFKAAQGEPTHFAQLLKATETGVFTSKQLRAELRQLMADYGPDYGRSMFEQEYECSFTAANLGAILGRWLTRATTEGRVLESGVFDPEGAPVEISSDIGFHDTASWWFWQPRYDGFGIVDYVGESGMEAEDWIDKLKSIAVEKKYKIGKIYLPHDANAKTFAAKRTAQERFTEAFGWDVVETVPRTSIPDRINAARRIIEKCWFDSTACDHGMEGLSAWAYEYNEDTKTFSKQPLHNWASHPGDAFSYGAQMMTERRVLEKDKPPIFKHAGAITFQEALEMSRARRLAETY